MLGSQQPALRAELVTKALNGPWHSNWSWGHLPWVGIAKPLARISQTRKCQVSRIPRKWTLAARKVLGFYSSFLFSLSKEFQSYKESGKQQFYFYSPPSFSLYWQGRNRKVCRVLWVSAANCVFVFSESTLCFGSGWSGQDSVSFSIPFLLKHCALRTSSGNACFLWLFYLGAWGGRLKTLLYVRPVNNK